MYENESINYCNYCFEKIKASEIILMSNWDLNEHYKPCCPHCFSNDLDFSKDSKYYKEKDNG